MALDREYFDSIHIDIAKQKYYNANKVNAVLEDIRAQAEALNAENESLRIQCAELEGKRREISDALFSAQAMAQEIISSAKAEAEEILRSAREQRVSVSVPVSIPMSDDAAQEYAVSCVESCMEKLRQQQLDSIEIINNSWREFLCGLMPETDTPAPVPAAAPSVPMHSAKEAADEFVPDMAELEQRVNAIAKGISELMDSEA